MGDKSAIEWTDATWNPIRASNLKTGKVGWHCEHITTGCEFCYAERFNARLGTGLPFKPGHRKDIEIFLDETMLTQPLRWKKPRNIFPFSMTDLFADFVSDAWIDKVFAVMALCPQHTFQILTKRSARMREYVTALTDDLGKWREIDDCRIVEAMGKVAAEAGWEKEDERIEPALMNIDITEGRWPMCNVWLGVSCEDQRRADERIPDLLATPAVVRFVSAEPLLGPIDFTMVRHNDQAKFSWLNYPPSLNSLTGQYPLLEPEPRGDHLDWIIAGGESGRDARPMHPDWVRGIRDQCAAAGTAFFMKQWGEHLPWDQFSTTDIDDDPEQTRFKTMEWEDGRWRDVGYPMWCDSTDGAIDDDNCVARVGKKRAGRILDGIEHNGYPA